MKLIAIVSSPLQLATFKGSAAAKGDVLIIGNRGMKGDISFAQSVLNDANFIVELDVLIGDSQVELYIPNSLNLLYFFALADARIKKVSFVDEGRLTKRFITNGYKKPKASYHWQAKTIMQVAQFLPKAFRVLSYKLIAYGMRKFIILTYEKDTLGFPYRTIERSEKTGRLLSHEKPNHVHDWVEFIDLTKDVNFPNDYENYACLFLHPRHSGKAEWLTALQSNFTSQTVKLLLRPHPNFSRAPELLSDAIARMKAIGIECEIAKVSGEQEVAIELYARGVRSFFCGETSITDTVEAYPSYFNDLQVVKI